MSSTVEETVKRGGYRTAMLGRHDATPDELRRTEEKIMTRDEDSKSLQMLNDLHI